MEYINLAPSGWRHLQAVNWREYFPALIDLSLQAGAHRGIRDHRDQRSWSTHTQPG